MSYLRGLGRGWQLGSLLGASSIYITAHAFNVNTRGTYMTSRPRGRQPGRIQDRPFQMRVSEGFLRTVDEWRRGQVDLPSRAEAIRRMVELASKMKKKPGPDR
jgi:hypothetical protein